MRSSVDGSSWYVRHHPRAQAAVRLYCFPHAGGAPASYRTWAQGLPPDVDCSAATLPGRGFRLVEAPVRRVDQLIESLGRALVESADRPFALFGHSMGGLVAFEVARWLRRNSSLRPIALLVSASMAPQLRIQRRKGRRAWHELADVELAAELRRLGGIPAEVLEHENLLQMVLPPVRADAEILESYEYRPEPPLECPISVFGGTADRLVDRAKLRPWSDQTQSRFRLRMFPGDHFFLRQNEAELLGQIWRDLAPT